MTTAIYDKTSLLRAALGNIEHAQSMYRQALILNNEAKLRISAAEEALTSSINMIGQYAINNDIDLEPLHG